MRRCSRWVLGIAVLAQGCAVPPVVDSGEFVSIASDDPNAVCDGAALALDRLLSYQAELAGIDPAGFHATLFLVSINELERRCDSRDATGCVTDEGERIWVREQVHAPHYLARALIRQQIGSQSHDFVAAGIAEALSGSATATIRFSSDEDLPADLGELGQRPGVVPLAGNFMSDLLRRDPDKAMTFVREAAGESKGRVETLFREAYGLELRADLVGWLRREEGGCSYGVPACSGQRLALEALALWNSRSSSCATGQRFDLGEPRGWVTVDLPSNARCSLRAETKVTVFGCGSCDHRNADWSVDATLGQWRSIDRLPANSTVAIETPRDDGGRLTLSCSEF